jgi:hypothetical protein
MKPRLPKELEEMFPSAVLHTIYQFVPPIPKQSPHLSMGVTLSPNMERDLRKIQHKMMAGKNEMYLRDLDDFVLK